MSPFVRLLAPALALALALPAAAHASAIVVWPVDPVIRPGEQATALWLENKGDTPVTLQVRTFAWSQPKGEDQLDQQDAVVASPPIATVAPGARQLVRIIRRVPAAASEAAFRLMIDELPPPPAPTADGEAPRARLAIQMRYSIPLFVYAAPASAAQLSAAITTAQGGRVVTIRNSGQTHARLTDLRVVSGGRETVVKGGLAGYVLAGTSVSIALPGTEIGAVKVGVNGVDQVLGPVV